MKHSILAAFVIAAPVALPGFALAQDSNPKATESSEAQSAQSSAQDSTAETVVATVNDQPITLGQMIVMKQSMQQNPQMKDLPDQAMWDLLLDQLIRQAAVASTGEETASVRAQLELQRRSALAAEAVAIFAGAEPTEEEIQATYDKMFGSVEPQTEYSAAHILLETEEQAIEVKQKLDNGEDFGAMAEEYSTGPSAPNKGELGWFTADKMVPVFSEAVAGLEPGEISAPVQSEFGWHVIKLNETRMQEAPKLEDVREQLVQLVRRDKVETEIERLISEANVEKTADLDPALINDVDLLKAK